MNQDLYCWSAHGSAQDAVVLVVADDDDVVADKWTGDERSPFPTSPAGLHDRMNHSVTFMCATFSLKNLKAI